MTDAPPGARPPAGARFEMPLRAGPEHADGLGHVNNVVYLQWMQDVATAHWRAVATPEEAAAIVWVVRRHELDYLGEVIPGDALAAHTWVGTWTTVTCERFIEIARAAGGKPLFRSRSVWVALDAGSGRPRRITPDLVARFAAGPPAG
jgi:acyl-CoA thioester hydrolase